MKRLVVVLVLAMSCGCGVYDWEEASAPGGSGGPRGGGVGDGGASDAGFSDAGFSDAGFSDAGFSDGGFSDAGRDDDGGSGTGGSGTGNGSFGNGGSGGDGASDGGDSTGSGVDAGVPSSGSLGEGDPCTAAPDCGPGLYCALQMTSTTNSVFRCSVCASENQPCGTNGSCIAIVTSNRPTLVCSSGQPGEPCRTGADCQSNDCVASISGGADRSTCR
ncbi:MAG: hypothetical protein Q8K32_06675 [Archangium sp.]|nr:hypothetical protein [Archangium sp.]